MRLEECPDCGEYNFFSRHTCDPQWHVQWAYDAAPPVEDWPTRRGNLPEKAAKKYLREIVMSTGDIDPLGPHDFVVTKDPGKEKYYVRLRGEWQPEFWEREFPQSKISEIESRNHEVETSI